MKHVCHTSEEQDALFHQWLEGVITNREFVESMQPARNMAKQAHERLIRRKLRMRIIYA